MTDPNIPTLPVTWPPRASEWPYWLTVLLCRHPRQLELTQAERNKIVVAFSAWVLTQQPSENEPRVRGDILIGKPPALLISDMPCQICGVSAVRWRRVYFDGEQRQEPGNWVAYCAKHEEPRGR